MSSKTILYAAAAFAAAFALVGLAKKRGVVALSGDAERLAGVQAIYDTSREQQAITAAAVNVGNRDYLGAIVNWRLDPTAPMAKPEFWM